MAETPSVNTTVQANAIAQASGLDTICILSPSPTAADITPRLFGSAKQAQAQHGYSEGVEYAALHRKPFIFIALPIDTVGVVGREDTSGNTDSCVTTVTAGPSGVLAEHDGVIRVDAGGTIGTDQILLSYSMDGGRKFKKYRLGTDNTFVIPDFGVSVAFAAGDLTTGETIHTWHGTAPLSSDSDWTAAREALAAQQKGFRSMLLIGDLASDTLAQSFVDELNAYETENERFVYGRASVYDRLPQASLSIASFTPTGSPTYTFDGTADTIERSAGSWIADGFAVGDLVTVNTDLNDFAAKVTVITADTLTFAAATIDADEVTAVGTIVGEHSLTFANAGDTITRNRGNWLNDGFRVGDSVTITGTAGATNDGTFVVATVTDTVLTLAAGGVDADEVAGVTDVTITAGQSKAVWMAELDAEFESIDDEPRIDLSAGRARITSPLTKWHMRRPACWFASVREYQHDLHTTVWRPDHGPTGADLNDAAGNLVEYDDRLDGGAASAARFTSMRTWSNKTGAYITNSLTRADDDSVLSLTHNAAVTNLACSVIQDVCENFIGRTPTLDDEGHATPDELATLAQEANAALDLALLTDTRQEGQRASRAVWTPDADSVLTAPSGTLNGVLDLRLRGVIVSVNTTVSVS